MNEHTGIDAQQFSELIIEPTLKHMDMWSEAANELMLGTAVQESVICKYLHQIGGPALGVYQIEPSTHKDVWINYLNYRKPLTDKIVTLYPYMNDFMDDDLLVYDLRYATIIARLIYFRQSEALPNKGDLLGQASYWKKYYNTLEGKGTKSAYVANYLKAGLA